MSLLILESEPPLCGELANARREAGRPVLVAGPAPTGHDEVARLAAEFSGLAGDGPMEIVHAVAAPASAPSLAEVEDAHRRALLPLLHLARALGPRFASADGAGLHVLTVGAADTGGEAGAGALVGAPVAAFALSLRHEFPALRVFVTDLEHGSPGEVAAALRRSDDRGLLALRGGRLLERVIEPVGHADPPVAPDGVHVITGGLGGVGRAVTRALRRSGGPPVALLQRRSAPAQDAGMTRAYAADVTDEASLRSALERVRRDLGPIGVVLHAAGTLADGVARTKTPEELAAVLAPKVRGAWLLDELTRDDPVEAFILFSSTVSLYGAAGQSDYAAANAFLDAFAGHRSRRRPGLSQSINWSLWAGTGMAADLPAHSAARTPEIVPLRPDRAADALLAASRLPDSRVVVEHRARPADRYSLLGPARPDPPPAPRAGPAEAARTLIAAHLSRLGAAADRPDADFFSLGMDSVGLLDLAAGLAADLGVELYPTLLFEYPSPSSLAAYLAGRHADALPPEPVQVAEPAPADAVAVVGYAYRFPGGESPEEFWRTLVEGRTAYATGRDLLLRREAPDGRAAALLADIAGFDPLLFKIAPAQAALMDPQHRLALECCRHALEHGGFAGECARRLRTGVFLGVMNAEYEIEAVRAGIDLKTATGTSRAILTNAVSYALGLRGPSMPVETACSSSLVAVHLAVEALRDGDADLMLAGGVNAVLSPAIWDAYAEAGLLSPAGRCRPFDRSADGYVRGEGVGVLVLRRLADALADGDTVHAVIRGTAVGHSGGGNGLGAPHPAGQAEVIASALARSGLDAADVGYVETHGTGTALGDPVEVHGLAQALGEARTVCRLSSVKGNIGHLEAAAGVASLVKVVHSFERETIAPIAGLAEPNPLLELDGSRFELADRPVPWPAGERPRRAAVSSFGFGGVNAHVLLEEPPPRPRPPEPAAAELVLVSGRTANALTRACDDLARHLSRRPELALADVACTLAAGREHLPHRRAIVAADVEELRAALRDPPHPDPSRPGRIALTIGPGGPPAVPGLPGARGAAYETELARWRDAGDSLAVTCGVVRWLLSLGLPASVRATGDGLIAAAALGGVLDPAEAAALAGRLGGTTGEFTAEELARGWSGEPWADWLARVSGSPATPADVELCWPPPGPDPVRGLLDQLGRRYESGASAAWAEVAPGGHRVPLPGYPYERERHWCFDAAAAPAAHVLVPHWTAVPRRPASAPPARDVGLCYAPDEASAAPVASWLRSRGHRCVVAVPAGRFEVRSADSYAIRMREPDDHRRLLGLLDLPADAGLWAGFLSALGATPAGETPLDRGVRLCAELTAAYGALRELGPQGRTRLRVVTAGAAGVGDASGSAPGDAALVALARVIAQETSLDARAIDLPPAAQTAAGADLGGAARAELLDAFLLVPPGDDPVVAFRAGLALVPGTRPVGPLGAADVEAPSAWWITGGLGALGLAIAEALAPRGVPIVLTSRRTVAPEDPLAARLAAIRGRAGDLVVLSGDVARSADVDRIRGQIRDRFGHGYGVVHAAGVGGSGRRAHRLTGEDFARVFAAKVGGAINLDRHTRQDAVTAFTMVSSLASLAGGWGLGDYAAANAALDHIARDRRARGLPAAVLNWTAVRDTGMAAGARVPLPAAISIEDALASLPLALSGVVPQLVVAADAPPPRTAAPPTAPREGGRPVLETVTRLVASAIGSGPGSLDGAMSLPDLGLDSRAQLALLGELEHEFSIDLPLELLGEETSLSGLADAIESLGKEVPAR